MSYILGALQKADRERQKKQGLSFDSLSDVSAEVVQSSGSSRRYIALGFFLGVTILVTSVVIWKREPPSSESEAVLVQPPAAFTTTTPTLPPPQAVPTPELSLPARLPVEGIVYVEGRPDQARVFIQGRGYRAGDSYQGLKIDSISASSIRLSDGASTRTYPIP